MMARIDEMGLYPYCNCVDTLFASFLLARKFSLEIISADIISEQAQITAIKSILSLLMFHRNILAFEVLCFPYIYYFATYASGFQ